MQAGMSGSADGGGGGETIAKALAIAWTVVSFRTSSGVCVCVCVYPPLHQKSFCCQTETESSSREILG